MSRQNELFCVFLLIVFCLGLAGCGKNVPCQVDPTEIEELRNTVTSNQAELDSAKKLERETRDENSAIQKEIAELESELERLNNGDQKSLFDKR